MELLLRFILGGALVSAFAIIGESVKPKKFAGIFGAAPSIALAGLILVQQTKGTEVMLIEARHMIFGSLALCAYSASCAKVVLRHDISPWLSSGILWIEWLGIAFILEVIS